MPFQYHVREMTAETSAEDFVAHFVHVEKFLPSASSAAATIPAGRVRPLTLIP